MHINSTNDVDGVIRPRIFWFKRALNPLAITYSTYSIGVKLSYKK